MLYCGRIDISEGIDLAKSKNSKECKSWFLNHGFEFQDYICNFCHDLTMLYVNISNVTLITLKNVDYLCVIHNISKSEAINLFKNSVLEDRGYI